MIRHNPESALSIEEGSTYEKVMCLLIFFFSGVSTLFHDCDFGLSSHNGPFVNNDSISIDTTIITHLDTSIVVTFIVKVWEWDMQSGSFFDIADAKVYFFEGLC